EDQRIEAARAGAEARERAGRPQGQDRPDAQGVPGHHDQEEGPGRDGAMKPRRWQSTPFLAGGLLALSLVGCATPPKPRELEAYEAVKKSPSVADAAKRAPDLVASSDRLGTRAHEEWESNDLEESRRDALMAQVKLKTALALLEQEQLKARIQVLSGQQADAEEEYANVAKDLAAVTEQLALLTKLGEARK